MQHAFCDVAMFKNLEFSPDLVIFELSKDGEILFEKDGGEFNVLGEEGSEMVQVSIVIPIKNEAENIVRLVREIQEICAGQADYEIIVVDDGSRDNSGNVVLEMMRSNGNVRLLQHRRSAGQSAAIHSGVLSARAAVIATLDGDGQNPPEELPKLFLNLVGTNVSQRLGLVIGQRIGRKDTLSKRLASTFGNGVRSRLLKDGTRDTGCGLKAFRGMLFSNCRISTICIVICRPFSPEQVGTSPMST